MHRVRHVVIALIVMVACWTVSYGEETRESPDTLGLSQDLGALLQAEMRELAVASQALVMAFVSGDWESIHRLSGQIRDSYVMGQNLTDAQKQELEDKLPDNFRRLDMEFHARANRLGLAAASEDIDIIAFHYYRLLETCAECHAEYATSRFPGFSSEASETHQH